MEPVRRCVACRRTAPKRSLVRLVVVSDDVVVDPGAVAPGRGAYLCGRPRCSEIALRRGGHVLRRALRAPAEVFVDDDHLREVVVQHRSVPVDGEQQHPGRLPDGGRDRAGPSVDAGGARPGGAPSQVVA